MFLKACSNIFTYSPRVFVAMIARNLCKATTQLMFAACGVTIERLVTFPSLRII